MRIFVCSPYRGDTPEAVAKNVRLAELLCWEVAGMGHSPFAPHLFCTRFLNDEDPQQREAGIAIGIDFLSACDELWYHTGWGRPISRGMEHEIAKAQSLGIPVYEFK